jgi:hypothetical protein
MYAGGGGIRMTRPQRILISIFLPIVALLTHVTYCDWTWRETIPGGRNPARIIRPLFAITEAQASGIAATGLMTGAGIGQEAAFWFGVIVPLTLLSLWAYLMLGWRHRGRIARDSALHAAMTCEATIEPAVRARNAERQASRCARRSRMWGSRTTVGRATVRVSGPLVALPDERGLISLLCMAIIWTGIALVAGFIVGVLSLVQPLIILVFGIPFTLEMRRKGVLTSTAPVIKYLLALLVLLGVLVFTSWAMLYWFPRYAVGYAIGAGAALVFAVGKCGRTPANMRDFFRDNARYMDEEVMQRYIDQYYTALKVHGQSG